MKKMNELNCYLMNKIFPIVFLCITAVFILNSCSDEDLVADELLYGGGSSSSSDKLDLTVSLNRVNGWYLLNGNHLYGFDIVIKNNNKGNIYNVKPVIKSISPSSDVIFYDGSSEMVIETLAPSQSLKPDFHWYVDNSGSIIYLGNFYLTLQPFVSSGKSYDVTIEVTFRTENQSTHKLTFVRTFTTVNIFLSLPI
jgi:hypothetical protein